MLESYLLHGLRVRSDVALPDVHDGGPWSSPDVSIAVAAARAVEDRRLPGEPLVDHIIGGRRQYTASSFQGTVHFRVPGFGDFVLDERLETIRCTPDPAAPPGFLPIMLTGNVLSFLLGLSGRAALHASAVEVDGGALAIVGMSGMGKSTLAAWLCAAGTPLVTDDVLRVDVEQMICYRGGRELRLRERARSLAFGTTRRTVDERVALRPASTTLQRLPLRAVVIPRPRPETTELLARRLDAMSAAMLLARVPRTLGWLVSEPMAAHFHAVTSIAERVPVHLVDLPWGPPFRSSTMLELLDLLELELPARVPASRP